MSTAATTRTSPRESLLATPRAQRQAQEISDRLDEAGDISVAGIQLTEHAASDGSSGGVTGVETVEMGDEIRALMRRIITIIAEGGTVTVGSMPEVITTTVAADLLGMSRTTLMGLVRGGELPHSQVGSHTKLRRDDVLAFRRSRLERQRAALDELLALEDDLDL